MLRMIRQILVANIACSRGTYSSAASKKRSRWTIPSDPRTSPGIAGEAVCFSANIARGLNPYLRVWAILAKELVYKLSYYLGPKSTWAD